MKKILSIFTSLKLTVTLLSLSIVLVFVGTLAQADEGLYGAQAHYFKQWIVIGASLFGHQVPLIWPGGYLLGVLLLVNLICAHIHRFQLTTKKIGLQLAHAGVIVLLVGQLATDLLSHELQMSFAENEMRNYSDSATDYELVFVSGTNGTSIPARNLSEGAELKHPSLPFTVRVKKFWNNSDLNFRPPMMKNSPPLTPNGLASKFDFRPLPDVKTTDQKNIPTALIELVSAGGSLGDWVVSDFAGDAGILRGIQNSYISQVGAAMAQKITGDLAAPQSVVVAGKSFTFTLRPLRERHDFSLTLLKATHTVYPGTDIPKDFRSRVRLENPANGEKREVEISMNHPLRYAGLTFYQYQMSAGELVDRTGQTPSSVLQVVRNPGWLTPYLGCGMVGAGLVIQFLKHLIGFISKQKKK